jgi:integrase
MGIYKRCEHGGRDRDRCQHPWYGTYKLPGQARAKVSLAKWTGDEVVTKTQALAAFDDPKQAVRSGTFDPRGRGVIVPKDAPLTFAQLVDQYEEKYVASKLRTAGEFKYRAKPLLAHFGPMLITNIRARDIEDFQAKLREPRMIRGAVREPSKASVNRPVSDLRRILNWAVGREYLTATPFRRGGVAAVKLDKEDLGRNRRIAPEEEQKLLDAAPPHLRALIILALDTGVRAGEMLKIRITDVDLDRLEITLRGSTTKSAKTRVVPIPTVRLKSVIEWFSMDAKGEPKKPEAALISNEVGEAYGGFRTSWATAVLKAHGIVPTKDKPFRNPRTGNLWPEFREALRRIDLHWHDCRHEYACRLAERGVPVTKIQALLGHAAVTTTMRYIHHTLNELAKATTVLESGGVFDPKVPKVGARVSSVSQLPTTSTKLTPETIQ